ncbi:MAG: hypothetical protein ACRCZS_05365, partial [Chroococcidiopsis sp.]
RLSQSDRDGMPFLLSVGVLRLKFAPVSRVCSRIFSRQLSVISCQLSVVSYQLIPTSQVFI